MSESARSAFACNLQIMRRLAVGHDHENECVCLRVFMWMCVRGIVATNLGIFGYFFLPTLCVRVCFGLLCLLIPDISAQSIAGRFVVVCGPSLAPNPRTKWPRHCCFQRVFFQRSFTRSSL